MDIKNIILILILIIIIFYFKKKDKKGLKVLKKKNIRENISPISKQINTNLDKYIEITNLKKCKPRLYFNILSENTNYINNSGTEIYQDILKPIRNKIKINNCEYKFIKIKWMVSKFKWNDKIIKLSIHAIFINNDGKVVHFVFPLDLDNIENFMPLNLTNTIIDTDFKNLHTNEYKMSNQDKIMNKNCKLSLTSMISREDYFPYYNCCKTTIGGIVQVNLCPLICILKSQSYFFTLDVNKDIRYLITQKQFYDKKLGKNIIKKISKNTN